MRNLFERRTATPGRAGEVKAWVSEYLNLAEADLVTIAELACHEPGCPPVETVLGVHGADGSRRKWHIHKALSEVEKPDVIAILSEK